MSVYYFPDKSKLYENIIEFLVFNVPVPNDLFLVRSRDRYDEDAVGFGEHLLESPLDFSTDIIDNTIGVVNLVDAVLDSATVFSYEFRKLRSHFVVGDIVGYKEHTKKIGNRGMVFSRPKYVDKIHKHSHKAVPDD